jgi:hypothetical protein
MWLYLQKIKKEFVEEIELIFENELREFEKLNKSLFSNISRSIPNEFNSFNKSENNYPIHRKVMNELPAEELTKAL